MRRWIFIFLTLCMITALASCGADISDDDSEASAPLFPETEEGDDSLTDYDFSAFPNVELTGVDLSALNREQLAVLYQQARYCQAITDADIDAMREIVSEDTVFTHMSGKRQTREEYFADVKSGALRYYSIGMENPKADVNGDMASVTYTAVLNANAYGARGTFRMGGTHWFEKRDGIWIAVNAPKP